MLGLVVLTSVAALIFHTTGTYAFPLTWILIGLAAVWICFEFLLRSSEFSIVGARGDHILRLGRHVSLRPDKQRSAADTIFLKNCLNLRRSIRSGFTSACIHGRSLPMR